MSSDRFQVHKNRDLFKGSFQLSGNQFLTEKRTAEQSESYGYMSGTASSKGRLNNFDWSAEGLIESSTQPSEEFYFGVPELFARLTDEDSEVQVSIGRQKRNWSHLDSELNLGLWQPQLRWDYLNPIQQGLTGVFFDYRIEKLTVSIFASPISLPDQGPQFKLEDGRFSSANRWFWQPQSRLLFAGNLSSLRYELDRPSVDKVIMNSSLGGMIQFDPSGPLYSQIAYAYKPMNQFFLGFECSNCIDPTLDGTALIHPMVVNHNLITWETGWLTENDHLMFSATSDRPLAPKIPEDWGGSNLDSLYVLGGSYSRKGYVLNRAATAGISYVRVFRDETNKINNDLTGQVESSSDRFLFEDLLSVSGQLQFFSTGKSSMALSTKYSYSFMEEGSWLSSKLTYTHNKIESFIGFDILGSQTDPLASRAGLFSRYRSNDRVFGGLGFVF